MNICETINLQTKHDSYNITVGNDLLSHASEFFSLQRRVMIVTDSGVPKEYIEEVSAAIPGGCYHIYIFPQGEENKNITILEQILHQMLLFGMQRKDCLIAIGGGVVGDITGFAASIYMRGIDFYNIPTTLLSQVDSSVGGKCAIDFHGAKNIIGAFWQPRGVLIDTNVLKTLEPRQFNAGMAEIIKMAATSNSEFFSTLEECDISKDISQVIISALKIKADVVAKDERESSIRKILNFGHTIGHGIEAVSGLLHGECVSLGMIPMVSKKIRPRLIALLEKYNLPTGLEYDKKSAYEYITHDKKGQGDMVDAIFVDEIGSCRIERVETKTLYNLM